MTPFFFAKTFSVTYSLEFKKQLKKIWPWEDIYFFSFSTQKRGKSRLSRSGMISNFSSIMLLLPNGMTPITNIYLIDLFKSIRTKIACYTSLVSLFLTFEAAKPNRINFHNFFKYSGLSYWLSQKRVRWPPIFFFFASLIWVGHYVAAVKVI